MVDLNKICHSPELIRVYSGDWPNPIVVRSLKGPLARTNPKLERATGAAIRSGERYRVATCRGRARALARARGRCAR